MRPKVCRICLKSNITRIDDVNMILEDFHEELCDFDVAFQNSMLTICPLCEYLLKKCYNFKLKCERAQTLLRNWDRKKIDLENLHALIPPSSLGFSPRNPTLYEFESSDIKPTLDDSSLYLREQDHNSLIINVPIKKEISDSQFEEPTCQEIILNDLCTEDNGIDDDSQIENLKVGRDIRSNDGVEFELKNENDFEIEIVHNEYVISEEDECLKNKLSKPGPVKTGSTIGTNLEKLKDRVIELMEQGEFKDVGSNITVDKDMFVHMIEKCNLKWLKEAKVLPGRQGPSEIPQIKKLLRYLYSRYHPKYEAVFNIENLDTEIKKLAEFEARRHGRVYLDAKYKCDICFKVFDAEARLKYHNKWHDSSAPHECDICHMRFLSRKMLNEHSRLNHCAVYRCKQCPLVTYNLGGMVNHYDQHTGVEYSCPVCLATFRNKSSMNTHRLLRHKTCHICPLCARSFVSDKGLHLHMKHKHRGESVTETVSCEQCSAKLATQEILQKHVREHHRKTRKNQHRCGPCKLTVNSVEELKQHRVTHRHVTPIDAGGGRGGRNALTTPGKLSRTCRLCLVEVAITHRLSLYRHYKAEHPQEPYTEHAYTQEYLCETCGKGFRAQNLYMDHMNTHLGLRPYKCTECEAKFPALHLLTVHKARHRPPRHKCKDCGKLFLSAGNLFSHRRTHTRDRKFKCDICFKGFLHRSTLNEHVRGVHHQIRRVKKTPRKENTK